MVGLEDKAPEWCDGCAYGKIKTIKITYALGKPDVIKVWVAEPCNAVRNRKDGKINPARLQYCIHSYNKGKK